MSEFMRNEERSFSADRALLQPAITIPIGVGALILFAPFDMSPFIKVLETPIQMLANVIPPIVAYSRKAPYFDESSLFLFMVFALLPAQVFAIARHWKLHNGEQHFIKAYRALDYDRKRLIAVIAMPFSMIFFVGGIFFAGGDPTFCDGCISKSKIGLLVLYGFGPSACVLAVFICLAFYRNIAAIFSNQTRSAKE